MFNGGHYLKDTELFVFQTARDGYAYTLSITLNPSDKDATAYGSLYLFNGTLEFMASQTGVLITNKDSDIENHCHTENINDEETIIFINQINLYGHIDGNRTVDINVNLCNITDENFISYY